MITAWESKFLEHITAAREAETVPIGKRECTPWMCLRSFACVPYISKRHSCMTLSPPEPALAKCRRTLPGGVHCLTRSRGTQPHLHGVRSLPGSAAPQLAHVAGRPHVCGHQRVLGPAQPPHHAARKHHAPAARECILWAVDEISPASGEQATRGGEARQHTHMRGRRGDPNSREIEVCESIGRDKVLVRVDVHFVHVQSWMCFCATCSYREAHDD